MIQLNVFEKKKNNYKNEILCNILISWNLDELMKINL